MVVALTGVFWDELERLGLTGLSVTGPSQLEEYCDRLLDPRVSVGWSPDDNGILQPHISLCHSINTPTSDHCKLHLLPDSLTALHDHSFPWIVECNHSGLELRTLD